MATTTMNEQAKRYVLIEESIAYDWDDYDLWANIYFDLQDKKFVISKYGHGTGCKYANESTGDLSLINRDDFDKAIREYFVVNRFDLENISNNLFLPCVVSKGRKFKGNLTLVRYEEKYNSFRSIYSACYDIFAIVWDKKKNQMCRIKPEYIEFDNEYLDNLIKQVIRVQSIGRLTHLIAYSISYSSCDTKNKQRSIMEMFVEYLNEYNQEHVQDNDITNVINIDDERERIKAEEKRQKKIADNLPNIKAWAQKTLPNGTEEEINELVKKVINKYYK